MWSLWQTLTVNSQCRPLGFWIILLPSAAVSYTPLKHKKTKKIPLWTATGPG